MQVEIVTHVYGDFYAALLAEQLRSLVKHRCTVSLSVCFSMDERMAVYEAIGELDRIVCIVNWMPLDTPQLLNRNIGRNLAARATTADWIWFCDADYLFGPGSLEALANIDPAESPLFYPQTVYKSTFFYDDEPEAAFDWSRYVPSRLRLAIGGAQIVPGDVARKHGYLDNPHDQRPVKGDKFLNTRGDSGFRHSLGTSGKAVDIPNVYRLRHRIPETSARHGLLPMVPAPETA